MNAFWNMATKGGGLPERFEMPVWQEAWQKAMNALDRSLATFAENTTWDTYYHVGQAVARAAVLREVICHIPLFLGGCAEDDRKQAEQKAVEEMEGKMMAQRARVQRFLGRRMREGQAQERTEALREHQYWNGFSPQRANCLRVEHEMQEDSRPLVFGRLKDIHNYPDIKNKLRNKALELGVDGYVIDARDHNIDVLMAIQSDESMRKFLWEAVQYHTASQEKIDNALLARTQLAQDMGCVSFAEHLNRYAKGLSFGTIADVLSQHVAQLAPTYAKLRQSVALKGQRLVGWEGSAADSQQPWNTTYFEMEAEAASGNVSLMGREFPLKRVLEHIIPDLLSVGGWNVVGKPQKVGRGKQCLYMYRLSNGQRNGIVYFAPYPHNNCKDSDNYQAYAAVLRERWTGPHSKHTTPIVLVAQNLEIKNGCLDNLEQLKFLAHEFGHVLHFLGNSGVTFEEFARMPINLSELPSLLLEQLASQPETLRAWCNPKTKASTRQLSYWQRRVRPGAQSLLDYVHTLEEAWLDIKVHEKTGSVNLQDMRAAFRKRTGLNALHENDQGAYRMFDFTEHAGCSSTYVVGRALTRSLVGDMSDTNIRHAMDVLLRDVLQHTSHPRLDQIWKRVYNNSICAMFCEGMNGVGKDHARRAKCTVAALNKTRT